MPALQNHKENVDLVHMHDELEAIDQSGTSVPNG